jgi:hypothetical protein
MSGGKQKEGVVHKKKKNHENEDKFAHNESKTFKLHLN